MDSDTSENFPTERLNTLDIELHLGSPSSIEKELIEEIPAPRIVYNAASELLLSPLIAYLKCLGFPMNNGSISYFSPTGNIDIYCGNEPLPAQIAIPLFDIKENKILLKCREALKNEFGTVITVSNSFASTKIEKRTEINPINSRRTKERNLGYIIEKVAKWRTLYNGDKMTLEEAANKVGIPKKSLDDYLLQLRQGKKWGFNFQEHKDDKVGILRTFNKKFKKIEAFREKILKKDSLPVEVQEVLLEKGTPVCKYQDCCTLNIM